jgi:hypothetical protein
VAHDIFISYANADKAIAEAIGAPGCTITPPQSPAGDSGATYLIWLFE